MKNIFHFLIFTLLPLFLSAQRNVVLIIADDLGTDYLGFYEDHLDTANMPHLRALLDNGVRFTNAMSNPICSATRAGILTGRYSFRTGVGGSVGDGSGTLALTEKTIPLLLEAYDPGGIATANIGKWHLHGPTPTSNYNNPNTLGYDHYSGLFIGALPDYYNWTKVTNGVAGAVTTYATTETVNDAIAWTSAQSNPFFLWLAFNAPHAPFHLPPLDLHAYDTLPGTTGHINQNRALYYKASLEALDTEIGRLLDSLEVNGQLDSTDIIFIGDNGNPAQVAQNGLEDHAKGTIYQYGTHVPMIISGPSVVNPGRVSTALVNTVDLFATILELFGYEKWGTQITHASPVDSRSLLPIVLDQAGEVRPWAFTEIFATPTDSAYGKAMRNLDYKLLRFDYGGEEFYHLAADPNEAVNLLDGNLTPEQAENYAYLSNEMTQLSAQHNPVVTGWLRNTTGIMGSHYVAGNSTPIQDAYLANVQSVKYNATWSYVTCTGIPSYVIGPYLDGNPSQGTPQNHIYRMPLNPAQNTGTLSPTTGGNIGAFINGVSLFDFRDGVSYNSQSGNNQGGPGGGMGDGVWNRDAVVYELDGFDCSKGHPANGNYHHHQNPSAFNMDLVELSNVCDLYLSDALYVLDSTEHSPLLGFAYDGFPIYGAFAYENTNGTGNIVRMKSGYRLRNITVRTHYADGTDVVDGPPVSPAFPLGMYREDYEYVPSAAPDSLDAHNGRYCKTPEYPNGTYCYFVTVNEDWNSIYPYVVGPTFYGVKSASRVTTIPANAVTYNGPTLNAAASVVDATCASAANGSIELFVNGGNLPYTYNWGGGVSTQNRTALAPGSYTVTVTDGVGTTATRTAVVGTQPTVSTLVNMLTCDPNEVGTSSDTLTSSLGCDSIVVTLTSLIPSNLTFTDSILPTGVYRSIGQLSAATSSVATGADVQFISDESVLMSSDFAVDLGALFEAKIEACPPGANFGDNSTGAAKTPGKPGGGVVAKAPFDLKIIVAPDPEVVIVQSQEILRHSLHVKLLNAAGAVVLEKLFPQGSTLAFLEFQALYDGEYLLNVTDGQVSENYEVTLRRE